MSPPAGLDWERDPEPPDQYRQHNRATRKGRVYANQGGDMHIYGQQRGVAGRLFLVLVTIDVLYFFYGMAAYSGLNTDADSWRAGIFLALLVMTGAAFRGWLRRRL